MSCQAYLFINSVYVMVTKYLLKFRLSQFCIYYKFNKHIIPLIINNNSSCVHNSWSNNPCLLKYHPIYLISYE